MKVYQLINDYGGLPAGTKLYGRYPILSSAIGGYYTQENIPTNPDGGTNAFFASAVEDNPTVFQDITQEKSPG